MISVLTLRVSVVLSIGFLSLVNGRVLELDERFSSVSSKYHIRGFPTIKFFKDGNEFEYNGPRSKDNIIGFAKRAQGPAVRPISRTEEFIRERKANEVMFVYVGESTTKLFTTFDKAASALFTKINFFSVEKQFLPPDLKPANDPTVIVLKDGTFYEIPNSDVSSNLLAMWINSEQFPSYNELTGSSYHSLKSAGKKFAISVLDSAASSNFNLAMKAMALERKFPFTFCWVTGSGIVNSMTYSTVPTPNVVVFDANTHEYFVLLENKGKDEDISEESILQFFDDIKEGKLTAKGGNGIMQNIKRLLADIWGGVTELFRKSPTIGALAIMLPTLLIGGLCFCLCTITDSEGEGPYTDTEDSDASDAEDLPPYKDNVEAPVEDQNLEDNQEVDPALGEGVRRRVKDN